MAHAASEARQLVREAQQGADIDGLVARAARLADPYHVAWALGGLARVGRRPALFQDAVEAAAKVHQAWRRAEIADELCKGDHYPPALVELVVRLPAGAARNKCLQRIASSQAAGRAALLSRVIPDVEAAKAVLRGAGDDAERLLAPLAELKNPTLRARLLGYVAVRTGSHAAFQDAVAAACTVRDVDLVRALARDAPGVDGLAGLVTAFPSDAEGRTRGYLAIAAEADRRGEARAVEWFEAASKAAGEAPAARQGRLHELVAQGQARLGGKPGPIKTRPRDAVAVPSGGTRSTLALHNGYAGGLKTPHLQAAMRAAALCLAFDLDLLLLGFPGSADTIVAKADGRIGDGAEPLAALHAARRLEVRPPEQHLDLTFPGTVVATTPGPDARKAVDLAALPSPVCVVMGLGHHGLPRALLEAAPHHLELTGKGVSLETATAMGVIAERLRSAQGGVFRASPWIDDRGVS